MHIKHGSWKTHQTVDSYEPVSSKLPEKNEHLIASWYPFVYSQL